MSKALVATLLVAPLYAGVVGCSQRPATSEATQEETVATQEATTSEATDTAQQNAADQATDTAAENTYTGTLRILTGQDLFEMQDAIDDPAIFETESDAKYAVLVFDAPTKVYARFAGDPEAMSDEETDMLCLAISGEYPEGNISAWEQYDGKKITIEIDPMKTMWPSDVRLPIGKPHTGNAAIISAE